MTTTSAKPPAPPAPAPAKGGPVLTLVRGTAKHRAAVAAGPLLALVLLYLGSGLEPFRVGQLTSVLIFAIAISGLNLVTGYTGLLSIGHSAFFGLGAYTTGVMIVSYQVEPLLTLPVAAVLCFALGFVVGLPALRIRGLYLALVTLAVGVAFPELVKRFADLTGGAAGLVIRSRQLAPPEWTGLGAGQRYLWLYWVSAVVLILVIVLVRNLTRSRLGKAMVAVRDNELAAASSGVHIASVKTLAFGLSGAVTGLAGGLFAMYVGALSPDGSFTLLKSIELITGLFLGGAATLYGPVAGALAVVFIPYYTADLVSGHFSGILFGAVLIAIVFVMPEGIVGRLGRTGRRLVRIESPPQDLPEHPTPRAPQGDASEK
ncbi:branched-chain amino acid ABC transporter permease [Actinocorallia sp. A-T 12471]|uniref:branched-chain amino acid ABC transporter permease n=1 Tax=Actinocorallia sp. A-T 12471 TaxID=3089813 RepID=UPI0029D1DFEF|nr:branched-chain amino acid ABC transporter permease [Actinocorallia sp. A-T 12471]MDX6741170.1 branched-chain amino acid ABC transporter permease [Actinocorallia sp. A-T 12471]